MVKRNPSLPVWLLSNLSNYTPTEVYEEVILNCSDEEIDGMFSWFSRLMREFDEALIDV